MKTFLKTLTVLFLVLIMVSSAFAQINWLKEHNGETYLAWDDGNSSKTIQLGQSAKFSTGYFGSTYSSNVHMTVNLNNMDNGQIVNEIDSKNINVGSELGYEEVTITPQDYKETERSGEKMTVDILLLRPAGLLATAGGALIFVISVPFSALGGNTKESYEELVIEPARYTFKRPLGDF